MPFASESDSSAPNGHPPRPEDELWARPVTSGHTPAPAPSAVAPAVLPPPPAGPESLDRADSIAAAPATALSAGANLRYHLLALTFALLGGLLGIFGAVAQEFQAGSIIVAGVIEEALKPAGIWVLLIVWPYVLRGRLYTASLTALSGLVFGIVEASVYVFLYFPDKGSDFVTYRFTVPLVLHATASFIFGLGIQRQVVDWANGVAPFPKDSRNFFIAAMALHTGFNIVAVILELSGVIRFD